MTWWRSGILLALIALVGLPLLWPFLELAAAGNLYWSTDDLERLAYFAGNSLLLISGTLLLSLPWGVLLATLLERTAVPLRLACRILMLACLFLPLPVLVSAWEGILGKGGWLGSWTDGLDRPWSSGLIPAIWVHALSGLPWVVLIVGIGLRRVEPELEEDALLAEPPRRVLFQVTLKRARGSILAAALVVALQTAGDISVTDIFQVATFAEEVHLQFALDQRESLARALAANIPWLVVLAGFLIWALPRLERKSPAWLGSGRATLLFPTGRWATPWLILLIGTLLLLLGLPLVSLVWKLGQVGRDWSASAAGHHLVNQFVIYGGQVLLMLAIAVLTGVLATLLAFLAAWAARECRWFGWLLFVVLVTAWVMPGPVAGLGLKEVILRIRDAWPHSWLTWALYYDTPTALCWGHLLRFFPVALALTWSVLRLTPRERLDALRLEGASAWQEIRLVFWPQCRGVLGLSVLVVTALSLGEVAAASRVNTPGWESFAKLLFDRMHYGFDNNVAAVALILLAEMALVGLAACGIAKLVHKMRPTH